MNVQDIYYHGVRDQIRRVLKRMGDERIDLAMTAFEDGRSSWSHCFFARGYPELDLNLRPEEQLMKALALSTPVPIRIIYRTFDGLAATMTRDGLRTFIESVRDESRPQEVLDAIRGINYSNAADTTVTAKCG